MFNPLKYFRNRKVGLALGSGGSKGFAHISVIEYLESMGIPIDMISGSSIGSVIGALYCAGSLKKFKNDILEISRSELFSLFDPVFPRSGLVEGKKFIEFLEDYIPANAKIEDLDIPLAITATDYYNAKAVVFRSGNILEAIRASISIPGILVPVKYKNTFLIDGGVANPLPINVVRKMGAGMIIAVNLHPDVKRQKLKKYLNSKVDRLGIVVDSNDIEYLEESPVIKIPTAAKSPGRLKSIEKWLGFNKNKKDSGHETPNIFEVISQSVDIMEYINTILMLKYYSPSVLIEPNLLELGTLDFTEIPRTLMGGYRACTKARGALIRNVKIWV
ncbi:MAG: hypothetical protein GY754_46955 [bacterium]|nr:hypothetical protein [bacterium]